MRAALKRERFVVDHVSGLDAARDAIAIADFDLVLLDRTLPDGEGLSVLPALRASNPGIHVIVLSARNEIDDRVTGLDRGADDYLIKPFSMDELLARIRAVRRRPIELVGTTISAGSLVFDLAHEDVGSDTCIGDAVALERVLANLVLNAIDHGGTHLVVRVLGTAFEVEDDGPGIPPTERERVFEPFHRLRPRATGSGLGLNLVQEVIDQHGGRVTIRDAQGGGTVFRVDLGDA